MQARFKIMARKATGEIFECFTWCRDAKSGIERAFSDAKEHSDC